jgi:hypothetical protein
LTFCSATDTVLFNPVTFAASKGEPNVGFLERLWQQTSVQISPVKLLYMLLDIAGAVNYKGLTASASKVASPAKLQLTCGDYIVLKVS